MSGIPMDQKERGKAEIAGIMSDRNAQYTHAVVRAALALTEDGQWKNCLTSIQLCEGEPGQSTSLVYPSFEVHEIVETPGRILELVDALVAEDKLQIADKVIVLREGRFDRLGPGKRLGQRVPSGESWVRSEWPVDQYLLRAPLEVNPPNRPLVAMGVPAYPDGSAAIEHLLGMETRGGRTWDGGVVFSLPDFRARICRVDLGTESLSVNLELRELRLQDLAGKVYARSKEGVVQQSDLEFHTVAEKVDLGLQPEHVYIGILCKSDGQVLDEWEYSPFRQPSRVEVAQFTTEYVQQLVARGEDSVVEYKPGTRDDNAKREMAETAVAFSNKDGGVILVGVDDNARIEGAFGEGWEDLIVQSLRDRCEPPVEPTVRRVVLEDKPVYVVLIPESTSIPHLLKATGTVYIRIASTDKPVTRHELDELFDRRQRIQWPYGMPTTTVV